MQININKIKQILGYRLIVHALYIFNGRCVSFELIDEDNMNLFLVTIDTNKYTIDYNNSEQVYNVLEINHKDNSKLGNYVKRLNSDNESEHKMGIKNVREVYYMDDTNNITSITYVSNYTYKTFRYIISVDFESMLKYKQSIHHDTNTMLSSLYSTINNRQYTTNSIKDILTVLQYMDKIYLHLDREKQRIKSQISKIVSIYRDINENEQRIHHKINILKSQGSGKPSVKGIHKDLELGKHEYILYKKLSNMRNVKDDTIKQYNILRHKYDNILLVTDMTHQENTISLKEIQTNLKILSEI